ncbi:DUF551 domain-containing protein [Cupriavidus basilensis]|uniref:DUF551 domain-containing protein n=1 Tax=Cupriavidus basilensis TaxID=68895 RepID=UPI000A5783CC|nr:DUF551 domain-containing protein [Cupriavidus basilensis]
MTRSEICTCALNCPHTITQEAVPDGLIERLKGHSEDKRNTAFARSSMREVIEYLATIAPSAQQAAPAVPDRWLSIETAPKDGRTLLLGYLNSHGKWRTVRGQWMSEDYIAEYWEEPDDVEPGWFETAVEAEEVSNCWRIEPTHWMPLPAAPAAPESPAAPQPSAKALTFAAGIEAAAKWVDKRREDHDSEFGAADPDTGAFEFRSVPHEEYSAELYEVAEGIRAIPAAEQPSEDKREVQS